MADTVVDGGVEPARKIVDSFHYRESHSLSCSLIPYVQPPSVRKNVKNIVHIYVLGLWFIIWDPLTFPQEDHRIFCGSWTGLITRILVSYGFCLF